MARQVHFAYLHCDETEDHGVDECVLKWNGHEFWSGEMKGGRDRNTDTFVLFPGDTGIVSLHEQDSPDEDDHLGAHTIHKAELKQGWHRAHFLSDEARYHLDYEVFEG
jgi:hypothetical protein